MKFLSAYLTAPSCDMAGRLSHAHRTLPNALCLQAALARYVSFSPQAQQAQVYSLLQELLGRHSSDDFLYIYLVLINQYVSEVGARSAAQ